MEGVPEITFSPSEEEQTLPVVQDDQNCSKKKGRVIQKNYVLNDTSALKKKVRNETSRKEAFNYGTDSKDGSNVVILMKTSFFEHMKACFIQDLRQMDGIIEIDNAIGSKAPTEQSGDAFVEYALDIAFKVDSNIHSVKFTAYATTCKVQVQTLGEKPKNMEHLGKKTPHRYFTDTFLFPWCEVASENKKYNEKELVDAIKSEIVRLDLLKVDTKKGGYTRTRISSVPSSEYKCVAKNCKYTGLDSRNKLAVGVCGKCGCYEHFECSKTKSEDKDLILRGDLKYFCSICFIENPAMVAFDGNKIAKVSGKIDCTETYNCKICNFNSNDQEVYTQHSKEKHEFVCETCKELLKSKGELEKHIRNHHSRPCIICDSKFKSIAELKAHMKSYHCPSCTKCIKTFDRMEDFEKHTLETHVGKMRHHCDICDEICDSDLDLSKHKKDKHVTSLKANKSPQIKHNCEICDKEFETQEGLETHRNKEHVTRNKITCSLCQICFDNVEMLNEHKKTHTEVTENTQDSPSQQKEIQIEVKCPLCDGNVKNGVTLEEHLKDQHTSTHQCSVFESNFQSTTDLKTHMEKEHMSQCTTCGKKFKTMSELKEHLLQCKIYNCGECDNTYFEQAHLNDHIKKNHENKCSICDKMFECPDKLNEHKKKDHTVTSNVCNEEERNQNNLKKHNQEVEEEEIEIEAYECDNCGFEGSDIETMKEHVIEKHAKKNKENQFTCTDCNYKCSKTEQLVNHYKEMHREQERDDTEGDINEKYRQLKNSFERLNTLFQESLEEVDRIKSEYTAKLLESNEKYRVTLEENEELKEKVDVLFKLGRSYIDKADNNEPKEASKEKEKDMIEEITIEDNHDHENSEANCENLSAWTTQKFRGFRRVSPATNSAPNKQTKTRKMSPDTPKKSPPSSSLNERLQNLAMNNPTGRGEQTQVRGSTKYCHFFSNFGKCHFEERTGYPCKFVHKVAPVCRSGTACTRSKCMYTHPNMGGRGLINPFLGQNSNYQRNNLPWQQMMNQENLRPLVNPWMFMTMPTFQQPMNQYQEQTRGRGTKEN